MAIDFSRSYHLSEYQRLLVQFEPCRIKDYDDPNYDRIKEICHAYFDRDLKNDLSPDEEKLFNLLCTLISEVDHRCK